ncbi:hypothetical protein GCM10011414_05420 [Croceivirga lutea]|uniref:hypothetical protein n=1 Tax=Croceivirga lutea TaxID=1775167 RepID=UPI0016399611|nr:hypothetical protein [Croceivirga lutea]GGG39005.1 hypothetical protein GCM10011414_05420 [Croceivirga lutea]
MNLKIYQLCLVALLIFSACKNSARKDENGTEAGSLSEEIDLEDRLIVRMNMLVPEDDNFEIYFRQKDEKFHSDFKIAKNVVGSAQAQDVEFVFDILDFPSHLRIDFGRNTNQGQMKLNSLVFQYNDNVHEFTTEELNKYFIPNAGMIVDFEFGNITTKKVNEKYNPYLNSNNISYFVNKLILF